MYTAAIPPFGSVTAEDVSYTPAPGYPPGTDNVQEALDYLVGATPTVAEMTPTVAGTAYGSQDVTKELNSLGRGVNIDAPTNRATARYNALVVGTPQPAQYANCLFDSNRCDQNAVTSVGDSIVSCNGTIITDSLAINSLQSANVSNLGSTNVGDSILQINETSSSLASVLDSAVVANRCTFTSSTFDQSCLHVTGLAAPSIDFEGATLMGSLTPANIITMRESMFLASNAGSPIDQQGTQSLYVGNQSLNETINTREAWISSYDSFFLRSLRNDTSSNLLAYYSPVTAELTYGGAPALAAKQPTTSGGQFGINSAANATEVNGRNSFNNYAAGPPQLTGVTAVGQQLYQASVPASNGFVNDIFLGHSHQFPAATSITNTLIAANTVGNGSISLISGCNMIVPRAASLTFGYVGQINGASFHSSGSIACTTDPLFASVFSSGGTVNPGQTNLVLSSAPAANSIIMQGQGNALIQSSPSAIVYNHPSVNNCTVLQAGTTIALPTANSQLCANHTSFLMPNINAVGTAGSTTSPMAFDSATGLLSPTLSPLLSRVYRAVGTTTGAGQVVFTPGSGVNPSTVGYAFNATVRDASTTVAYPCSIVAVSAVSITVQVFQSVLAAVGSPTIIPAVAGIIVHFSMCY